MQPNKNLLFQGNYNLENPNEIIKLEKDLLEISGLSETDKRHHYQHF